MGTSSSRSGRNAQSGGNWSTAKTRVTKFAKGTGSSVGAAVGAFAAAVGGSGGNGSSGRGGTGGRFASSVRAGQALGSFLGSVASSGLDQTLRSIGLESLIGAAPYDVLSGIADDVCGSNGLLDDVIARSASVEVLAEIFDDSDDTYSDLRERWESQLDENRVVDLISLFLSQAIYQRFLVELGHKFETNAVSAAEAERKEQGVFEFIREMVIFELGEIDPLSFDWQGLEGERLIQRNLSAALGQMEAYA